MEIWTYVGRTQEKDPGFRTKTNLYITDGKVTSVAITH
jgi:hypothetical protein